MHDGSQFELELQEELKQYTIPKSWLDEIEAIKETILHKNVLISLVGEQNGGKSTFAKLLYLSIQKVIKPYYLCASMLFDAEIFLAQIQTQLGLNNERSLKCLFTEINQRQQPILLIIDEAQHIPETFLIEILSTLQNQNEKNIFHICLISHTNALTPIKSLALSEYTSMIESHELKYLTEEETRAFVQHRISQLGYPMPKSEMIHDFYHLTEGNLVAMNNQFDLFFKQKESINPIRVWYWGGAITLVISLFFAFFMAPLPEEAMTVTMQTLPSPTVTPKEAPIEISNLVSEIPAYYEASNHALINPNPFKREQLNLDNDNDPLASERLAIVDKVVVAPKIIKQPSKATLPKTQANFTIQILASSKVASLKLFAKQHQLKNAQIKTTINQGRTWYILAYGQYPTRELAKKALLHLPGDLLKFRPWVRAAQDLRKIG